MNASERNDRNEQVQFVARTDEHMPECTICDTTNLAHLKDAVAVIFRPNDPPMLAQVYCRRCIQRMSMVRSAADALSKRTRVES